MRPVTRFTLILVLASFVPAVPAQQKTSPQYRYRWTDAHGVVQYTDAPTAEALRNGYDVVDGRGSVVRHVERVKTAEEQQSEADAADAAARARRHAEEAAQANQQLLRAYPSEQALIEAQKQRLGAIDQDLANVKISQADQEKSLAEQLAYAATFERDGKPVPATVRQQVETLRSNVESQKKFVAAKLAQRAEFEQKTQAELAHYRELRAMQAKGVQP